MSKINLTFLAVIFLFYFNYFLEEFYVDNGILYQKSTANPETSYANTSGITNSRRSPAIPSTAVDSKPMDSGNYLDETTNICCGLCGEIVSYESLINEHLPTFHPDVMSEDFLDLEEIPYDVSFLFVFKGFHYSMSSQWLSKFLNAIVGWIRWKSLMEILKKCESFLEKRCVKCTF